MKGKKPAHLLTALLSALLSFPASGQAPTNTARFSPVLAANINGFWEYLPRDYDADITTTYPLLIYIHGAGDQGSTPDMPTLGKVLRRGPAKLIAAGTFPESFTVDGHTFRFIVICPQIKNGVTGLTSTISPSTIDAIVEYARTNRRVDNSRIYVIGMSMGGGGTWDYAGSTVGAPKLAAIVAAAGAADLTNEQATRIADEKIAVLATHNTVDNVVLSSRTEQNIAAITAHVTTGPVPKAIYWDSPGENDPEFNDALHNVWTRTFEDIQPGITENGNLRDTIGESVYEWLLHYNNSSDVIVPLIWDSFTAKKTGDGALLQWKVSYEMNVKEFVIEKSPGTDEFTPVATVPYSPSKISEAYEYLDSSPLAPVIFYRIKEVDENGQYSFSEVRKIMTEQDSPPGAARGIQVFPNPVSGTLHVRFSPAMKAETLLFRISDARGGILGSFRRSYTGSEVKLEGLERYARGCYFLSVYDQTGRVVFRTALIKQ